jgi:hypothetical protein
LPERLRQNNLKNSTALTLALVIVRVKAVGRAFRGERFYYSFALA